eukprot:scaffold441500_cov33-Prasinocladus_malaysianus.AAC.1
MPGEPVIISDETLTIQRQNSWQASMFGGIMTGPEGERVRLSRKTVGRTLQPWRIKYLSETVRVLVLKPAGAEFTTSRWGVVE